MSATHHILLIDDHVLIRSGLRMVVESGVAGALVREVGTIAEATRDAAALPPDLVLLDIEMPGLNGLDGLTVLRKKWPVVPVVMLSSHTEPETVRSALARGAAAYVMKGESSVKLLATIFQVLRGQHLHFDALETRGGVPMPPDDDRVHLTSRQCEVLELICEGLSNKLIARKLDVSENTVRGHVQAVLACLQVSSRSEAAFAARQRRLVR